MRAAQVPRNEPRATSFAASRAKGDAFGPGSVSLAPFRDMLAVQAPRDLPGATLFAAERAKGDVFGLDSVSLGASRGSCVPQVA